MGKKKHYRSEYECLYSVFWHIDDPYGRFECFYCGSRSGIQYDHQPPISRVPDYQGLQLRHERFIKVPSCSECNGLAGDHLSKTVIDRDEYIKTKLKKKYASILRGEIWSMDDLDDAGIVGRLRGYIRAKSDQVQGVLDRLEYTKGVQAYVDRFDLHKHSFSLLDEEEESR